MAKNQLQNDPNNVLNINPNELKEKLFNNIKKQSKKAYINKKIRKNYFKSKGFFDDFLGIDNAIPEQRKSYNLVGEIGEREAHFTW